MRVDIGDAVKLAGLDRMQFNDYVADGLYPCAPVTEKGRTRTFGEDDLVTLVIFARLLTQGHKPRTAGQLACRAMSFATNPRNTVPVHSYETGSDKYGKGFENYNGRRRPGEGPAICATVINIDEARAFICQSLGQL